MAVAVDRSIADPSSSTRASNVLPTSFSRNSDAIYAALSSSSVYRAKVAEWVRVTVTVLVVDRWIVIVRKTVGDDRRRAVPVTFTSADPSSSNVVVVICPARDTWAVRAPAIVT
jgi:hypothetical protein